MLFSESNSSLFLFSLSLFGGPVTVDYCESLGVCGFDLIESTVSLTPTVMGAQNS